MPPASSRLCFPQGPRRVISDAHPSCTVQPSGSSFRQTQSYKTFREVKSKVLHHSERKHLGKLKCKFGSCVVSIYVNWGTSNATYILYVIQQTSEMLMNDNWKILLKMFIKVIFRITRRSQWQIVDIAHLWSVKRTACNARVNTMGGRWNA